MAGPVCASCSTTNPEGARFCMACGAALELRCASCGEVVPPGRALLPRLRDRDRDGRGPGGNAAPARRGPGRGAPAGDGPVRRPLGLHRGRRAHGPRGGQGDGGALPAASGRRGRALRRDRGQVHRRQRHGVVRSPGGPRGRRRAGRPRRAGHAGGDGGDQRRRRPRVRGRLRAARRAEHGRGPRRGRGRRLYGDRGHGQRRRPPPGRGAAGRGHGGRAHRARHPRRGRIPRDRPARAQGEVRARSGVGGRGSAHGAAGAPGPRALARRASWDATTSSPSSMPPTAASCARAGPTSSRSSGRPAWASRGWPASWRAPWSVTNPPPRCARDAACPTARASCTGRSPRSCGRSAGSPTATRPTSRGRSSRPRSTSCWPRRRASPGASPPSARRRSSRACSASAPRRTMRAASRWTRRGRERTSSPRCAR